MLEKLKAAFIAKTVPTDQIPCRLCGGQARHAFDKIVLRKHKVRFYRCTTCGSVETQKPFWLDEAYSIPGVHVDVGIASRTIKNWVALATLFTGVGLNGSDLVVDFGGATGLLARLLRDVGYNAKSFDKYAVPSFTSYFNADHPQESRPRVVTAFEVFEHFEEPRQELTSLLAHGPDLVVFTTWFCDGQPDDWIYYAEDCAQHIFLYTQSAMRNFANAQGYDLVLTSYFHVLVRKQATAAIRDRLAQFTANAQNLAGAKARELFESVALGNGHMEADYKVAEALFKNDLDKRKRG